MVYRKRDRDPFVAILGFVKYCVAILIFWKNGWSIPFNTIFYYALQIDMTLDNSKQYIITVYYKTRGPYNPLL